MSESLTQRFRVGQGTVVGGDRSLSTITLSDLEAESMATFVPELGFACVGFRVFSQNEQWNVLAEPPDVDALLTRTSRFGIPILFPWPNRIRDGRFTFEGREYQMPLPPNSPHATHGFARQRPWTVDGTGADDPGAFCRASVTLGQAPDDPWPFPSRLTFEYRLHGTTLAMRAEATNLGNAPMPMGLGIHPYFGVPFGSGGSRAGMDIRLPAASFWELDETFCTTGTIRPVVDRFDTQSWLPLADRFIDDVYTRLTLTDGWCTAELRDPSNGRVIAVRSDGAFREHVVFAPLHADVVCLEPYTCATDAFNLAARGIDAGLIVLGPERTWRGEMAIEARG